MILTRTKEVDCVLVGCNPRPQHYGSFPTLIYFYLSITNQKLDVCRAWIFDLDCSWYVSWFVIRWYQRLMKV